MATNEKTIPVSIVLQNIAGAYNRFSDEYDELSKLPNDTENLFDRVECMAKLDALKYLYDYFKEHYGN